MGLVSNSVRGSLAPALSRRHAPSVAVLPKLPVGTTIAALGDSIISRGHAATTGVARTTQQHKACSELMWALGYSPRGKHFIWWDATATIANDIPTYGEAAATNNLFRGLNFGYSGDTTLGATRRIEQVIGSGAGICLVAVGTNTDAINTAANKIAKLDQIITGLRAGGVRVWLATIRPRWTGERATLTNAASTTEASRVITIAHTAHGMTNTSGTTKNMEFVGAGLTVGGLTIPPNTIIQNGSQGYSVNVLDANSFTITCPATGPAASATVNNGGGEFTYHRNVFTDLAGTHTPGNSLMPSDPRHGIHRAVNEWIVAQAGREGVRVANLTPVLRDPVRSALTGVYLEPIKAAIMDGVHISGHGAMLGGSVLRVLVDEDIEEGVWFDTDPGVGNLLASGILTGTGGTAGANTTKAATSAGVVAQLPTGTGVFLVNGAGQPVTIQAGMGANDDVPGGNFIEMVITSSGAGSANAFNEVQISHSPDATTGFTATDWVQAYYEVEGIGGDPSHIMSAWQVTMGEASAISTRGMGQTRGDYNTEPQPFPDGRFWIRTEPMLVESRAAFRPRIRLSVRADVVGTCTFRVRRVILRVVPSPEVAAPWVP